MRGVFDPGFRVVNIFTVDQARVTNWNTLGDRLVTRVGVVTDGVDGDDININTNFHMKESNGHI